MQEKIIKRQVNKQLKRDFPNWRKLPKKTKKRLTKEVLQQVVASYKVPEVQTVSLSELTCTPAVPVGIIPLNAMDSFIERETPRFLRIPSSHWQKHYDDPELREIDELLDDQVLNLLLAPEGYTACMRDIFPCH